LGDVGWASPQGVVQVPGSVAPGNVNCLHKYCSSTTP
jgi:BRCT domain type II-containing protein